MPIRLVAVSSQTPQPHKQPDLRAGGGEVNHDQPTSNSAELLEFQADRALTLFTTSTYLNLRHSKL